MTYTDLETTCGECGRSPWVHPLRGGYLFCDEVGGQRSSFTLDEVNIVRMTIGKSRILTPRPKKNEVNEEKETSLRNSPE